MQQRAALLTLPLVAVVFGLLVYPLALLGWLSLHDAKNALTLGNYAEIFNDRVYFAALAHSLCLSAAVAAIAVLLCLAPAWLFARHDFAWKRLMRAAFTLPMSLSGIMVGFFAVLMLGRIGFVPQLFERFTGHALFSGAAYQHSGLVIAYLYFEIPRGVLTLEASLRKFNPRLDDAARSLGANRLQRLFWIVLPLIRPALISTFAVTFSVSLGSFGVALILSRRFAIMPLELFHQFTSFLDTRLASAMALVLVAIALTVNSIAHFHFQNKPPNE